MRIVAWNCCKFFYKKIDAIKKFKADIYVISECEHPTFPDSQKYKDFASNYLWIGANKDKSVSFFDVGLGIFAKDDTVDLELVDLDDNGLRYFIPVTVDGKLNLLGVWTNPNMKGDKQIFYPKEITKYYEAHKGNEFFNKDMVICGDFNCDKRVLKKEHGENVDEMIAKLEEIGLVDVYHDCTGEEEGKESIPTHFWRYEKPFHVDHVFAEKGKVKCLQIGEADEWLEHSDHMPIVFEI